MSDLELVFFDPFSPRANPELWTPAILSAVRERCREEGQGALLATYSAATPTRVTLLLAGYFVGAGVSTGSKQETTVAATRREALLQPLGERWLARWERSSARGPHGAPLTGADESAVLGHPQFIGLSPHGRRLSWAGAVPQPQPRRSREWTPCASRDSAPVRTDLRRWPARCW